MPELYQVNITQPAKEQLSKSILSLAEFPHRVMLTPEEPWKSRGIHRMPVNGYLVYFWIDEQNHTVQILAVVYGRRDQNLFLSGAVQ